jgi:hypothetical protein
MDPGLPKRVLSIDSAGGGIGITLGYLARLEQLLRIRYSEADFRLCDYFDLIAGSGLGAIIAADLARGRSVSDLSDWITARLVKALLTKGSSLSVWLIGVGLRDSTSLSKAISDRFAGQGLDPAEYRTGVALVFARLNDGTPMHISNHPDDATNYKGVALSQVLFGCNATMLVFPPVPLKPDQPEAMILAEADIVGVSNPALYVLQIITSDRFAFRWPMGSNRLSVFSVSGLSAGNQRDPKRLLHPTFIESIAIAADSFLSGTNATTRLAMASLALSNGAVDEEGIRPLTYRRFELTSSERDLLKDDLADLMVRADRMSDDDMFACWPDLLRMGRVAAEYQIGPEVFAPAFDVRRLSEQI